MALAVDRAQMFIGGRKVDSVGGATEPIINPATEDVIAEVPLGSKEDVDKAVSAAEGAFEAWSEVAPGQRARMLLRLADRLEEHGEELAQLESLNVGKPIKIAREEVTFAADNMRYFAGAARNMEGKAAGEYLTGYTSMIRRDPLGVVAGIAPWNYPLMMAVWKMCPALMAGNTLVLKPSELTPLTALRMADLAADLFPEGVFNVITGHGESVGVAMSTHPRIRMVSLTGDVSTGKDVARAAADNLKRVHLELGGKAPVIVFDDANIAHTVDVIRAAGYLNSGQDCAAACRVYVGNRIHDNLLSALVPAVRSIKVGDPQNDETEMGPVISRAQSTRIQGYVDRAVATGHVQLATGGNQRKGGGFYYEPSVVVGALQGDEITMKEVFGPVVTVSRFASDDEVIRWANDVEYGLTASVFTSNLNRALNASRRLQFGTVWINDHMPITPEMPHGGFKQSGYGKDMSMYALEAYTEVKHVMARTNVP